MTLHSNSQQALMMMLRMIMRRALVCEARLLLLILCDDDAKAGVGGARLWRLGLKPLGGIVGPFAYKN